ncbi:hypothetical protein ABRA89_03895 [Fulvimarina sp. MAC8]
MSSVDIGVLLVVLAELELVLDSDVVAAPVLPFVMSLDESLDWARAGPMLSAITDVARMSFFIAKCPLVFS